ncbi:MAG: cbb3-type cytochrome oxidase assembly protein CcoS [Casimicrobiaceae bacterium]
MEALYILIPLSLVLVVVIAAVFWWSASSGQFEDLEREGQRILEDDPAPPDHPSERNAPGDPPR